MKKIVLIAVVLCSSLFSFAQPTDRQRIEDSVIGWKQVYSFKGKQYKSLIVEGQSFSPYQQSLRDTFITWMQRTYKPIGGFGDIFPKDFTTSQKRGPVPQGIGMYALVYGLLNNRMVANEDHNDVGIFTNTLAGTNPVRLFNSTAGNFFTMPKDNYETTFSDPDLIKLVKEYGLHDDARFSRYMAYFDGYNVNVVLVPGNRLPILQLTKGEVLQECEKGLAREVEERKKEARQMSSNNPSYYAGVIKDLEETLYPQCIKNLNAHKEKYKNKLNEPAVLYGQEGPSFADFTGTSSAPTVFIEDWYQKIPGYPAYRYTKEALENSKKDKPLWVSISWQPQKPNTRVKPYEVHRAMLRYFNFDYVYDYFFDPEKVKGKSYSVANAAEQTARMQQLKTHWVVAENKPLPLGVLFADDFSGNTDGGRPAGWTDSRGKTPATVVSLKNKSGKWVQLGHLNELSPSLSLKNPLPENFTIEFDMMTDEFSVRTGGAVKLSLSSYPTTPQGSTVSSSKGTILEWQLIAGNEADYNNNNYSGEARPLINSTAPGYDGIYYYSHSLREFTNKKTSLHATVKVKNGQAVFFINGKQIAVSSDLKQDYCKDCICKGVPPNTSFRKISFTNMTQNWSPDGRSNEVHVYISNIKITKE